MKNHLLTKYKLSPAVAKAFGEFILYTNLSNGGHINNNTWEALYNFIEYTHAHSIRLGEDEMRDLLMREGASPDDADEIAQVYFHGRNLLYKKRPWDFQRMYGWLQTKTEKKKALQVYKERKNEVLEN